MTSYPSPILFNPQYQRYVLGVPASAYVMTNPQVYLVFWGAQWKNQSLKDSSGVYTNYQAMQLSLNFFQSLGGTPWVNTLTQYCQGIPGGPNGSYCPSYSSAQYITNPTSLVKGWWVDDVDALPSKVDLNSAQVEAWNAWNIHFRDANAIYLIFTPSGEPWDFFGSCAWHDENDQAPGIAFGVIPYQPDRGQACAGYSVNPASTTHPRVGMVMAISMGRRWLPLTNLARSPRIPILAGGSRRTITVRLAINAGFRRDRLLAT